MLISCGDVPLILNDPGTYTGETTNFKWKELHL